MARAVGMPAMTDVPMSMVITFLHDIGRANEQLPEGMRVADRWDVTLATDGSMVVQPHSD